MLELGELDKAHAEFTQRGVRVFAVSNDNAEDARWTQEQFPHLVIISDADQAVAKSMQVMQSGVGPGGGDSNAPTTFLIDGAGQVRWLFRPTRFIERLSPEQVLDAVDNHRPANSNKSRG